MDPAIREVVEKCEWVAIATVGPDGPHLAATWGDYIRALGVDNDVVLIPAGGLRTTEANLRANPRIELLLASREIQRAQGTGQGCVLSGTAEFQTSGAAMDKVKARFPWARAALVVRIERAATQL
jgi:predicted pyridoxine 5'-phosphate oxidase superfamily flavin-nucleotide-binding protein